MITKSEKSNWKYTVHDVKKATVNGQLVTRFKIKDPIKNLHDQFTTINVTVFEDLAIDNGQKIKILDFDNLIFSYYEKTKKINVFVSAIVEIVANDYYKDAQGQPVINNPYSE